MAKRAAGSRVKFLAWFAPEEPHPSKPKSAALTSKPSKSLFGELARWYHRSAAPSVTRGKHVARHAPPARP